MNNDVQNNSASSRSRLSFVGLSSLWKFWSFWTLVAVVVLGAIVVTQSTIRAQIVDSEVRETEIGQKLASQMAQEYIVSSEITLRTVNSSLARLGVFNQFKQGPEDQAKKATRDTLDRLLIDTISIDERLTKLRIINARGQELARVDRTIDGIVATKPANLQDKSARPYVRNAIKAGPGALLTNQVSFNEEFGEVTEPKTAVVRFTFTITGADEPWILVSSVRLQDYVNDVLGTVDKAYICDLWMARADGVMMIGGEQYADLVFADQLGLENARLEHLQPELWEAIGQTQDGTLTVGDDLFVFSRVDIPVSNMMYTANKTLTDPLIVHKLSVPDMLYANGFSDSVFIVIAVGALAAVLGLGFAIFSDLRSREILTQEKTKQNKIFSIVAHELRTPASAIDMMIRGDAILEVNQKDLEAASTHLLNVIDDLRQVMHPQESLAIQKKPFSFGTFQTEIDRQMAPLCSAGNIALVIDATGLQHNSYVGDAYRLRVVVTNLIRNAVVHSQGTTVWLRISSEPLSQHQDLLTISVDDDGVGIPKHAQPEMYDMFSSGDTKVPGAGVGLAIVKQWTETMGGEVQHQTSPYGGAGFRIQIPLDRGRPDFTRPSIPDSTVFEALKGRTVLLAEDDRILRQLTIKKLEGYGCKVLSAGDGEEALEILSTQRAHLLITDYFMPKLSGKQLIQKIRESDQALAVIAITAASIGSEADDLRRAGADAVLAKPFSDSKFETVIASLIVSGRFGGMPASLAKIAMDR